jgi:glycosyltransferase involved in cell wall biosynthesis
MAGAVAVVLPSQQEGLPRCILEAMSIAVPVIGTRIRGTSELLEDGAAGVLVDVGDVEALAGALRRVLDDPETAREVGRRGQLRVGEYDVRKLVELHEQLYAEALAAADACRRCYTSHGWRPRPGGNLSRHKAEKSMSNSI